MKKFTKIAAAALVALGLVGAASTTHVITRASAADGCSYGSPALVQTKHLHGRTIVLFMGWDNVDAVCTWGEIQNGQPGDVIWLDHTTDAGASWSGWLVATAIPDGMRQWRTEAISSPPAWLNSTRTCAKTVDHPKIVCSGWDTNILNAGEAFPKG